jgi:DNA-binding CsgD family transcriptional regulator
MPQQEEPTPIPRLPDQSISPRECQLLDLASLGLGDKEIASRLSISVATVRTYWERIRQKIGATNRSEAIAIHVRGVGGAMPPRDILRVPGTAVIGVRKDLQVVLANSEAESLFCVGPGDLIGKLMGSVISERFQAFHSHLRVLLSGRNQAVPSSVTFSVFGRRARGVVPLSVSMSLAHVEGGVLVICVLTDQSDPHHPVDFSRAVTAAK